MISVIEPIALICVVNGPKELLDLKASLAQATFVSVSEDAVPCQGTARSSSDTFGR